MTGSITKRGKNRYLIRIYLGRDANGKQKRFTKTFHGTKKEAEKQKREWIAQHENGGLATATNTSLDAYMRDWFRLACKDSVAASTLAKYQVNYDRYISPRLGHVALGKLSAMAIQAAYQEVRDSGVSVSTIKLAHAPLSRALKQAVKWKKLAYNPCQNVDLPLRSKDRREILPLTEPQANQFLDAAASTPWVALWTLAIDSGMRPGEYLGLPWENVDWKKGAVTVRQAVTRPAKQQPRIGKPKTKASYRTIPLAPETMELLKEHQISQRHEMLSAGTRWRSKRNLVFPGKNGVIWDYQQFRTAFNKTATLAELPTGKGGFTPYCLRHTMATLLLLANVNPKIVQERLGHSKISETLDTYSHVLPTMQEQATSVLSQLLSNRR